MVNVVKSYKASDDKLFTELEGVIEHEIFLLFKNEMERAGYNNFIGMGDIKHIFRKREELKYLFEVYEKMKKEEREEQTLARQSVFGGPNVSCDARPSSEFIGARSLSVKEAE